MLFEDGNLYTYRKTCKTYCTQGYYDFNGVS